MEDNAYFDCVNFLEQRTTIYENNEFNINYGSAITNNTNINNDYNYITTNTTTRDSGLVKSYDNNCDNNHHFVANNNNNNNNNMVIKNTNVSSNTTDNNNNTHNTTNNTANYNDICVDMRRKLVCFRNILNALQTINTKCETVIALCSCHTITSSANNSDNNYNSNFDYCHLLSKYKQLRDSCDLVDFSDEHLFDNNHSKPKNKKTVVKTNKIAAKTSTTKKKKAAKRGTKKRRAKRITCKTLVKKHSCWFEGCYAAFHKKSNLVAHIAKHTGEKAFVCTWPGCGKEFPYKRSLDRHVEALHLKTARYRCEWPSCGNTFITKSQLDCHMTNKHTGEKWYKCDEPDCQFSTNYLKHMKDHKLRHDPNYVAERSNNSAKQSVAVDTDGSFDDELINKKTGRPLIRRRRPKNNYCQWPNCSYAYDLPNELKRHMRKHTGETPFGCEWPGCDKQFGYKHALKIHVEMVHLMLKKYKCSWPACDAAFVSQIQLDVHNRDIHIGVKKFKCDWPGCEWIGTNHARELRFHKLRRHEGVKIIRKSEQLRKERLRMQRQMEKKHVCNWPQCGMRFVYKSMLAQHLRSHRTAVETTNQAIYSMNANPYKHML